VVSADGADLADDPLRAAVALMGREARPAATAAVRLLRRPATPEDSAWARADGGVLVVWPRAGAVSERPPADVVGGVATGSAVVVAAFERTAPTPMATPMPAPPGRVVGRWVDGAPAAMETPLGAGCVRQVAVPVPEAGDVALRPAFRRLVAELVAPCGGVRSLAPLGEEEVARLRGAGGAWATSDPALARERAHRPRPPGIVPWLLGAALVLALLELWVRRRTRSS
jgi:hypothetical protein